MKATLLTREEIMTLWKEQQKHRPEKTKMVCCPNCRDLLDSGVFHCLSFNLDKFSDGSEYGEAHVCLNPQCSNNNFYYFGKEKKVKATDLGQFGTICEILETNKNIKKLF